MNTEKNDVLLNADGVLFAGSQRDLALTFAQQTLLCFYTPSRPSHIGADIHACEIRAPLEVLGDPASHGSRTWMEVAEHSLLPDAVRHCQHSIRAPMGLSNSWIIKRLGRIVPIRFPWLLMRHKLA
jgi:hypothetical protein